LILAKKLVSQSEGAAEGGRSGRFGSESQRGASDESSRSGSETLQGRMTDSKRCGGRPRSRAKLATG